MKQSVLTIFLFSLLSIGFAQSTKVSREGILQFEKDLTAMLPETEPGAAVIVTLGNEILLEKYYGLADLEKGEKLNSGHVMGIASMSKQFTGMAVLFLVSEGKLKLEDPITRYFPDLPVGDRQITIKQLLSHISGLPELTQNITFMNSIDQAHTVNQIIEVGLKGPFRSAPGEKYIYCNTGYTIIVALIEKLSGKRFAGYLGEKIFTPLNMMHTYACDYHTDAVNAVQRYMPDASGFKKAEPMHFSNLIGGGGIISNVRDMAKWGMALLSGKHLPANHAKLWQPNLLNSGESTGYGLGMGVSDFEGKSFYYHPGMGSGMNSINLIFPDYHLTITVIRNISKPKTTSYDIALLAAKYLLKNK